MTDNKVTIEERDEKIAELVKMMEDNDVMPMFIVGINREQLHLTETEAVTLSLNKSPEMFIILEQVLDDLQQELLRDADAN